jgi:hypothetical protein
MKTFYRVHEFYSNCDKFVPFFTAQYKPWWFPFFWFDCYGSNTCLYKETADEVCRLHKQGVFFNEEEVYWTINHLDLKLETLTPGTSDHHCLNP